MRSLYELLLAIGSYFLKVTPSGSQTADRVLSVDVNDGDRTVSLSGNLTVSAAATVSGTNTGDQTSVSGNAGTVTVADAAGDTTTFVLLATDATGSLSPRTDAGLSYNANTNVLTSTGGFVGDVTGNAATVAVADTADSSCFVALFESATGSLAAKTDAALIYDASSGLLSATTFEGSTFSVMDTLANHALAISLGEDLSVNRTLTLTVGNTDQTLTLAGNATISQDYSTTGNPQFATVELGAASDTTLSRSSAGVLAVEGVTVALNSTSATHTAGTLELGAASDTTLSRASAGNLAVEGNVVYRAGGTDVPLADGGTGASLADPGADRVMFWDDSAGAVDWLTVGNGLSVTTTTIAASTATAAEVINTSGHSITSVSGTYEDVTGLTFSLPAAGTYLVTMVLRGQVNISAGTTPFITARLDLNGSTVTNSEILVVFNSTSTTGIAIINTISASFLVTAAGAHTLKVQAKRDGTGITWTSASIAADANGKSSFKYVRLY